MDIKLAKYPFLKEAKKFVEESETELEDLVELGSARARAKDRVIQAIEEGKITIRDEDLNKKSNFFKEIFSYPLSRILVSCIEDSYLIKRYSLAEAKSYYEKLENEKKEILIEISKNIGIKSIKINENNFKIHFSDYLKLTDYLKEKKWKLVNQILKDGFVYLNKREFRRLLQEGIRKKIEHNLPINVPEGICKNLNNEINQIRNQLEEKKSRFTTEIKGIVKQELFPPCMSYLIREIKSNKNLSHPARFAIVSFLINIGMDEKEIVDLFEVSPDFDRERTRYQVDHISGQISEDKYIPPACSTLKTYNLCAEKDDWRCKKVSHPLGYYEWRIKSEKKEDETEN